MSKKKKKLKAVQNAVSRKKRRSGRKKRAVILVMEVIVLLLLSGTAYVMAKYDKFHTVTIVGDELGINDGIGQEGYTTVALFGGDSREGELEKGTRTDTIIIAAIDNETREIKMASVYRDTLLRQKNGDYQKANYAYSSGGPKEALSMLNTNLDLDIENYVTVDFKALVDTIDLLGGIDIDIKDEEIEPLNRYIKETAKVAGTKANPVSVAGKQHLDGAQAVTYSRIRSTEGGDYTRTERQRLVIEKLFEKVMKTDLSTVDQIIDTVFSQVSTSFTLKELIALASGLPKYKMGDNTGFPIDKTDGEYGAVGSIVIPVGHVENVRKLHEFLYPKEEDYVPSDTVEEIAADIALQTGVTAPNTEEMDVQGQKTDGTDHTDTYETDQSGADTYEEDIGGAEPYGDFGIGEPYAGDPTDGAYEEDGSGEGMYGAEPEGDAAY